MPEDNIESSAIMPLLFIGHGSPMNAIEKNEFVSCWSEIIRSCPAPEAILCISAHWETKGTMVTAMERPKTIHDFGGFPEELYRVQYPAPGSPELALEIQEIIKSPKIESDFNWGLDHGTWSILKNIYPQANIPAIQLSLDYYSTPEAHFILGSKLASLRKRNILIIGSGNIVHNLRMIAWEHMNEPHYGFDWAIAANNLIKEYVANRDYKSLIGYKSKGQEINLAIPTPDHFLPLLYIAAMTEENETIEIFNDKPVMGSLTMTSFKIG
jgi:4,5-DOPA dioxygenase extradiol